MAHRVAPEASADLDDIWEYIATASRNVARADRVVDALTSRFYQLATFPISAAPGTICVPACGGFAVGDSVILYRIEAGDVQILHVLHVLRDIASMLRE